MARLNESTTSTESIEILKRRFVRQNREIARVNSIQSLRIRSLESEVSHLLSENVSLRERVINLSQEIERFEAAKLFQDGVYDIKAKLDNKLMELEGLVADLGALPRRLNKPVDGTTEVAHQERSGLDSRHNIADLEAYSALEQDGRLPVILEDKYYPRKTLEPQEMQELMNNNMNAPQSSGQGGPSISQIDSMDDDPYSTLSEAVADTQELDSSLGPNEALLPPNLETRKKRKAGTGKIREDILDMNLGEFPARRESSFLLNPGSKRKFSGSDDGDFALAPPDEDDFQFTRPTQLPQLTRDQLLSTYNDQSPVERQNSQRGCSKSDSRPKRKVLEPKSTNLSSIEPQAPEAHGQDCKTSTRMNNTSDENKPIDPARLEDIHGQQLAPNERSHCNDSDKARQEEIQIHTHVAEDTSRSSSPHVAVSQVQHELETSIPSLNASSRPTRRQRSVVSYAEPNLRDKMRRPTDEFIAAVGSDHHPRRASGSSSVRTTSNSEFDERKSGKIIARKKRDSDMEGRNPRTLPMTSFDNSPWQPANMMSRKQRKASLASKEDIPPGNNPTNEINEAHSYPIFGGRELVEVSSDRPMAEVQTGSTGKHGSPIAVDPSDMPMELSKVISRAIAVPSRLSRRHSTNPRSSGRSHYSPKHEMSVSGTEQESMTGSRACLERPNDTSIGNISEPKASMHASEAPPSAIGLAIDARQMRRVPRAAARRKSMML
ncbi:shugoshin [Aspergillus bombycis]|uniref:Shugoshin n=1 Tax=Aspergillus bombycis TaxID=109264 RepID=A0A1F7ZJ30_9EURO|nr:shugoshin [Aspergillus bombycis]OGM39457.1 shugoshin [Aspergillus bombycis]